MISKKTVFVIGAGASKEFGLPTGEELKQKITSLINIKFKHHDTRPTGDEEILEALRSQALTGSNGRGDVNPFLHAAWSMVSALPLSISIDNYLEAHAEDSKANIVGKLGIVRSILKS